MSDDLDLAFTEVAAAATLGELEAVRRRWLGRKGIVTLALREHARRVQQVRIWEKKLEATDRRVMAAFARRYRELGA